MLFCCCCCLERVTDRDNFMSAEEAREFGLIDHVLSHQQVESKEEEKSVEDNTDTSSPDL